MVTSRESMLEPVSEYHHQFIRDVCTSFLWYEHEGVKCPYRCDHQLKPSSGMDAEKWLEAVCLLLGVANTQLLVDLALRPLGIDQQFGDLVIETKCSFKAFFNPSYFPRMMAKASSVSTKYWKLSIVYFWAHKSLVVAIPTTTGGKQLLSVISVFLDGEDVRDATTEYHK